MGGGQIIGGPEKTGRLTRGHRLNTNDRQGRLITNNCLNGPDF